MINIYDTANQLEQDLRQTKEYQDLKVAMEHLKDEPQAYECYQKVRNIQEKFQQKQLSGEEISKEDLEEMRQLAQDAENYSALADLMMKEQALNTLFEDINKIIFQPVRELY